MAAGDGDSLCALVPVPNLGARVDWSRDADRLRDALLQSVAGVS